MTFNDGSTCVSVYNAASNVVTFSDENGSVLSTTFDPLGRMTECAITPAPGVMGTTAQSFQYDGLSHLTFSRDTVLLNHADASFSFDSLGRSIEESQVYQSNTRTNTYDEWTSLVATGYTYPQGRQLANIHDALFRRIEVKNRGDSSIAKWQFFGAARPVEVEFANGIICTMMNNSRTRSSRQSGLATPSWGDESSDRLGYDGAGRMATKRYIKGGINDITGAYNASESFVGFSTEFDVADNKLYERELHAEDRSHLYEPFSLRGSTYVPQGGYDSIDRLRLYRRGLLDSVVGQGGQGGGEIDSPTSLPGADEDRTYVLDGLGNWLRTAYTPVGDSPASEDRQHNKLNQITRRKTLLEDSQINYDKKGNISNDGTRLYTYDVFNRLLTVNKTPTSPQLIATYIYDAGGRRIRKTVSNGGLNGAIPNGMTDFVFYGPWCMEERDANNVASRQYVWGIYIDELIQQRDDPPGSPIDQFLLSDLLYRAAALTNSSGDIVEAYDTDAYGNAIVFTSPGSGGNWFVDNAVQGDVGVCDRLFTGQTYDYETALYMYRARYYDPALGRFISRDPAGTDSGINLYEYVHGAPIQWLDPLGLTSCEQLAREDWVHHTMGDCNRWQRKYAIKMPKKQGGIPIIGPFGIYWSVGREKWILDMNGATSAVTWAAVSTNGTSASGFMPEVESVLRRQLPQDCKGALILISARYHFMSASKLMHGDMCQSGQIISSRSPVIHRVRGACSKYVEALTRDSDCREEQWRPSRLSGGFPGTSESRCMGR